MFQSNRQLNGQADLLDLMYDHVEMLIMDDLLQGYIS